MVVKQSFSDSGITSRNKINISNVTTLMEHYDFNHPICRTPNS